MVSARCSGWAPSSPTSRSGCSPNGTTGSDAQRAARPAGHGHLRQGRRAAAHRRSGRPPGGADHLVQGAHRGGEAARLPVADPQRAARPGSDRRLRPLALRGRADRAGARAGPSRRRSSGATTRSTPSRPSWWPPARRSSSACCTSRAEEQKERLLARLDDPTKHWKFNPGDIDERARWPAYRDAYQIALERTNTDGRAVVRRSRATRSGTATSPSARLLLDTLRRPRPAVAGRRLRRRGAEARGSRRRHAGSRDPHRRGHPLRHAAARGRLTARAGRGRRPGHLRLQVPRRRPGRPGPGRRGGRRRAGPADRAAHSSAGGARARSGDRALRGRRGGAGPAQRQPRPQPRRRLPARRVRLRRRTRRRSPRWRRGCCGWTPSAPTSTAAGATPTCCCGTATCG